MKILGTYETRSFSSLDEAKNFVDELEKTVSYDLVDKSTMLAGEVIDCPIMPEAFEKAPVATIKADENQKAGIAYLRLDGGKTFKVSKALDEQMGEAMRETRLVIGGAFDPEPLAMNALPSLVSQAIGGKSSVLCQTEDKNVSKQMRTEIKSAIINEFLSLRKDNCRLYKCDGMVRYVASNNYVYLPISELLDTAVTRITAEYPAAEIKTASISHQYCEFLFVINDPNLKDSITNIIQQAGITGDYEPAIIFATSNTGDSGANLYPVLLGKGDSMLIIEEPSTMDHVGSASIEKFGNNIDGLLALFKATPERLEKLSQVALKHPANAYKNVAFKSNLPLGCFAEQAEVFEQLYGGLATALDLYFEITNQLYAYAEQTNMNFLRRTKLLSSVSQKFLSVERLADCDVDLVYAEQK